MLAMFVKKAVIPDAFYQLTADRIQVSGGPGEDRVWTEKWHVQLFADGRLLCEAVAEDYSEVLAVEDWFKERMRSRHRGID